MQWVPIDQAQHLDGISAFIGIVGLPGYHAGCQDDQRFRVLREIVKNAARFGQADLHPVTGGGRRNKRVR